MRSSKETAQMLRRLADVVESGRATFGEMRFDRPTREDQERYNAPDVLRFEVLVERGATKDIAPFG